MLKSIRLRPSENRKFIRTDVVTEFCGIENNAGRECMFIYHIFMGGLHFPRSALSVHGYERPQGSVVVDICGTEHLTPLRVGVSIFIETPKFITRFTMYRGVACAGGIFIKNIDVQHCTRRRV